MKGQPHPLATQFASLRAAAEAHTSRCWLTAALEAMIMTALARIFGQLEEIIRLWQAGLLPALPNRPSIPPVHQPQADAAPPTRARHAPSPRAAKPRHAKSRPAPINIRSSCNPSPRPRAAQPSRTRPPKPESRALPRLPCRHLHQPATGPPARPVFQWPSAKSTVARPYCFVYKTIRSANMCHGDPTNADGIWRSQFKVQGLGPWWVPAVRLRAATAKPWPCLTTSHLKRDPTSQLPERRHITPTAASTPR